MNCPQCGQVVPDGATACPSCGAQVAAATASAVPPGASQPYGSAPAATGGGTAGSYKFDLNNLTLLDRVCAVATFVLFISFFFGWYTVSVNGFGGGSSNAYYNWFMYFALIFCLAILGAYGCKAGFGKLPFELPITFDQLILALGGLNLLLVIIAFIATPSYCDSFGLNGACNGSSSNGIGYGFGAILGLIAALAALAPTVWPLIQKQIKKA